MLCIAEKYSVAKEIAVILSSDKYKIDRISQYNFMFQFSCEISGHCRKFIVIHGAGHNKHYKFQDSHICDARDYFTAPIISVLSETGPGLQKSLEACAKHAEMIIACEDNDREGEHIAYESIEMASRCSSKKLNIYPSSLPKTRKEHQGNIISCTNSASSIPVRRCRFSSLSRDELIKAFQNLGNIDTHSVDAVDVRMELDLRIGFAMSSIERRNSSKIMRQFPQESDAHEMKRSPKMTFGTCQIPTLGLCYNIPPVDDLEKAQLSMHLDDFNIVLTSEPCVYLFAVDQGVQCQRQLYVNPNVRISVEEGETRIPPPPPLNTIELEKGLSHISASDVMKAAERLYQDGYISYPRTETQVFPTKMDLEGAVKELRHIARYRDYIEKLYDRDIELFRENLKAIVKANQNNKRLRNDKAHPPIHFLKVVSNIDSLQNVEKEVYDYVIRHFLASVGFDAVQVTREYRTELSEVRFGAQQKYMADPGWQEVLHGRTPDGVPENKYGGEILRTVQSIGLDKVATPMESRMTQHRLISSMDKYGIGTDATIAEHIQNIKNRMYIDDNYRVQPAGKAVCELYEHINYQLLSCTFRSTMEAGLREICTGRLECDEFYNDMMHVAQQTFCEVENYLRKLR